MKGPGGVMGEKRTQWRGVFGILPSPFTADDRLDVDLLAREATFAVGCGVGGTVFPGIASESYALTDEERRAGLEAVVRAVSGRAVVLAGVSSESTRRAVASAEVARGAGADGVMVMAPRLIREDDASLVAHFRAVADAADLPIMLQSHLPPWGTPLSIAQLTHVAEEVPQIRYVKQEVPPTPHGVSALLDRVGERLGGVFGGAGGLHAVEELIRGSCGTMPAVHLADVFVRLYREFEAGDLGAARRIHRLLLPAIARAGLHGPRFGKAVLVQRGVLRSDATRDGSRPFDRVDSAELMSVLEPLAQYMVAFDRSDHQAG